MNYEVEELTHRPQNVNLWETERMKAFRKNGLIGCLNGTGVTSENYKEFPSACLYDAEGARQIEISRNKKMKEKSSLEMMADIGLLGAIEDSEVTSENYKDHLKGYKRKNRVRQKVKVES